ncbi:hypothetical protein BLOT_016702, partial [Blomia tropicalis]
MNNEKAEFEQTIKEVQIQISTSEFEAVSVFNLFRTQNKAIGIKKMIVEMYFHGMIESTTRKRNPDKLLSSIMSRILPSDQTAKLDSLKNSDTISNKSFDLDKNEKTYGRMYTGTNPDTPEDELNQLSKVPPNKLTKITNKVMTKVATKVTEMGDNPTVPSTSFARFLNRGTDENYISWVNPFEVVTNNKQYQMYEHYQLPTQKDVSIIDLGSIIAYALTTPEYERKLLEISLHLKKSNEVKIWIIVQLLMDWYKVQQSKILCCIYFAEQFRRLRSMVLVDGAHSNRETARQILSLSLTEDNHHNNNAEDFYIHSLSCCIPWNAMVENLNPSSLVKIVGVYQISYKNTSKASVHHILLAKCTRRSELFQSNHNQTTTVLMDENLRQISTCYPLYVHEHSKKLLMEAIFRDSEFLCVHGVMDYSLLVGFDEQFSEYVVGIIDYVRLFNWEKEIEFRVKKLGKAIDPTIVHPSQYQRRFLDAINDYFIEVPDKWHSFMQLAPLANRSNVDTVWE